MTEYQIDAKKEILDYLNREILESTDLVVMYKEYSENQSMSDKMREMYKRYYLQHEARIVELKLLLECYQ